MRRRRGFTLLELITVVAVLAIVALVAVPRLNDFVRHAQDEEALRTMQDMFRRAEQYSHTQVRLHVWDADVARAIDQTPGQDGIGYLHGENRDRTALALLRPSDDGSRWYLMRYSWGRITGWVEETGGCTCTVAYVLAGNDEAPDGGVAAGGGTGAPPGPGAAHVVSFLLVGGTGGPVALDDVRVTSSYGTTGADLFLRDSFTAAGPRATGSVPEYVTADADVNTGPVLGGAFSMPPGVWLNPDGNFGAGLGTPVASGGLLRASGGSTVDQLVWDFTSDDMEMSATVAGTPAHGELVALMDIDPARFMPDAQVSVDDNGAQLTVAHPDAGGAFAPTDLAFANAAVPVTAGARVALRQRSGTWFLVVNGRVRASADPSHVGAATGTVVGAADPTACTVQVYPAASTGTPLGTFPVAGDGAFTVVGLSDGPVKLRAACPEGTRWLGGTGASAQTATVVTFAPGTVAQAGTVSV